MVRGEDFKDFKSSLELSIYDLFTKLIEHNDLAALSVVSKIKDQYLPKSSFRRGLETKFP